MVPTTVARYFDLAPEMCTSHCAIQQTARNVVICHLIKPGLSLWAVPPLREPLHIEVCFCSEVVLRRMSYFVVVVVVSAAAKLL